MRIMAFGCLGAAFIGSFAATIWPTAAEMTMASAGVVALVGIGLALLARP